MNFWFWFAAALAGWGAVSFVIGWFVGGALRLGDRVEGAACERANPFDAVDWSAFPDYRKDRAA